MLDRIKFVQELANELNMANFMAVTPIMAENATAGATGGVQCGQANMLADVYSPSQSKQFSVKTYKDTSVSKYMNDETQSEPAYTDFIIERRVSGVGDPNAAPDVVFTDVLSDIYQNEARSLEHYGVQSTETILLGYNEDDDFYYFRLSEVPFQYDAPALSVEKTFTAKSKNYLKHEGNRSSVEGYNSDGALVYQWVHPNNQTYTRCLKKRYDLRDADSMYFKIKKQTYTRPDDSVLLGMVTVHF